MTTRTSKEPSLSPQRAVFFKTARHKVGAFVVPRHQLSFSQHCLGTKIYVGANFAPSRFKKLTSGFSIQCRGIGIGHFIQEAQQW
jgi:hypothetical protein